MTEESNVSGSGMPRWEIILLVLAVFIVAGVGLQKCGLSPMYQEGEISITDNPHSDGDRRMETIKPKDPRAMAYTLDQVAKEFSNSPNGRVSEDQLSYFGLEPDECSYFVEIYDQRTQGERNYSASEWRRILQKAAGNYQKVTMVFQEVGMRELRKPSGKLFKEMEHAFGIPEEASRNFALGRNRQISDWALFVDQ